ncbi:MAG: PAS domain S-box protein [Pseudomonadota bacterium]
MSAIRTRAREVDHEPPLSIDLANTPDGGAVNLLVDIAARKANTLVAERLASIIENSDDAIVSKDLNGTIRTWNKGAERVFGYSAAEAIGQSIMLIIPEDRRNEEAHVIARIRAGERIDHYETIRRRKDGSMVDISLSVSPIADGDGNIVGASKIARDITDRRRAERQRQVLVGELNHRVKNTLATVQSIASQTFRGPGEPGELLRSFEGRLFALSRAHDQLSRESWEAADLHATLEGIFAPYGTGEKERIRLIGEPVRLSPQAVVAFAMVLHELATNAAKYGALSRPRGAVEVKWNVSNSGLPPSLEMVWQETGGPPVKPPKRAGFGSRFIDRAVSQELNGKAEVAYDSGGLRCRIEVPLPSL